MLNFTEGTVIAKVISGRNKGKIIYLDSTGNFKGTIKMHEKIEPRLDVNERSVSYISGPAGSGKTTHAIKLIIPYIRIFPEKPFFLFSRTNYKDDPAYKGLKPIQISLDESLILNPIDITQELVGGSIVLFDDCNTLQDDKLKKIIDKLMADIMEVGRKLDITIIITNHLVIPNDKKIARTIMNEMQSLTVFPKSGSAQQIRYVLKIYFGLDTKQIEQLLNLPSRWVTILKKYPLCVLYDQGVFIL